MRYYTDNDWKYFLRLFSDYDNSTCKNIKFTYEFFSPMREELLRIATLQELLEGETDAFKKVVRLLKYVNSSLRGDGMCVPPKKFTAATILTQTKKSGLKSNCWMYAVVLTELCIASGLPARMVRCMPMDLDFQDCHCITVVFLEHLQRWVVFDPANRAYYLNKHMEPMDLPMLRRAVIHEDPIFVPLSGRDTTERLIHYFTKNLFRFACYSTSKIGNEYLPEKKIIYQLLPQNYELSDQTIKSNGRVVSIINLHNENVFWQVPSLGEFNYERCK